MSYSAMMEKKPSSIKQTAAKIKTKIHNTSSFFKLSLKTNNKALALALAAQKQKTRQLETDAMRLQKDVQSLNFDLAVQRHKNKQMFTILREFYNNSINCMAKAVDFISNEEGSEILDAESSKDVCQAEQNQPALLPEPRNTNIISKAVPQEKTQTPSVNMSMVDHRQPHNSSLKRKEHSHVSINHTAPQNTLYDSEMEITMVDSAAEIVTVQTKPIINHDDQQRCETNNTCSSKRGERSMSSFHKATAESSNLKDMIGFLETTSETQHLTSKTTSAFTCSNEEDPIGFLHGGERSFTAHRKTHVTSRNQKNKRCNLEKLTAENPDTRKSGITPSHSSHMSDTDDLDDFFRDQEVQTQRNSKTISCDGNFSKYKDTESEEDAPESQNEGVDLRKTFVIPPKSRPRQSRKSKASSVNEGLNSTDAATLDMVTDVMEMYANSKPSRSKSSTHKERNTMKSRGTYVIYTNQLYDCSDVLNANIDLQVDCGEIANTTALECNQESHSNNALTTEEQRMEEDASHILENRPYLKHSITVNDKNLPEQISSLGHTKPKKAKTETVKKTRKKNITTTEKAIGKKKQQCSSTQSNCSLAIKTSDPLNNVKEINSSTDVLRPAAGDLHSVSTQEAHTTEFYHNRGYTINVQSRHLDHNDDLGTSYDVDINPEGGPRCQNNQNSKSKSRQTYVVLSGPSLSVKGKENTVVFNSTFEESLITNDKENSLHADSNTFFPHHCNDNQSTPRKTDQVMQQQKELLDEERPPWESLSFDTSMSLACDSPVTHQRTSRDISSRTMDIYEEPGLNMTHQSPDRRAMKSLTNTDLTADAPSRSRRKAAPMSYKEPPLNSKMRRGDKFSDTRFLRSPVFKDKRTKHSKKNKQ